MAQDEWDDLPSGNYCKWENDGDTLIGDIIGKGKGEDLNGNQVPQLIIRTDDGDEKTMTASQAQLRAKLLEARPKVGDRIKVVFDGTERRDGGKTLKKFTVSVQTGGAKAPVTEEAVTAAEEDF